MIWFSHILKILAYCSKWVSRCEQTLVSGYDLFNGIISCQMTSRLALNRHNECYLAHCRKQVWHPCFMYSWLFRYITRQTSIHVSLLQTMDGACLYFSVRYFNGHVQVPHLIFKKWSNFYFISFCKLYSSFNIIISMCTVLNVVKLSILSKAFWKKTRDPTILTSKLTGDYQELNV